MSERIRRFLASRVGVALSYLYLVFSFALPDAWLRVVTRWIGAYSIYEIAPNLFTLTWAVLLTATVTVFPSRKVGRVVFGIVYSVCMTYAVVQYGAYLALDRFLFISDFLYAGEGAGYASWVIDLLTPAFLLQIVVLFCIGVLGVLVYPVKGRSARCKHAGILVRMVAVVTCVIAVGVIPTLYGTITTQSQWSDSADPAYEYRRFSNANFDMELTGIYQYVVRDLQVQLSRGENREADIAMIDSFFAATEDPGDNEMTGFFAGKNVIVVMMETMDDWMITEEDTPTLYHMVTNGIYFSQFYTPQYSNGYTFNTEFAFNTSVYPYSNGNVAYSLVRNKYDCTISARFDRAGYAVNSFHEGNPIYYNREVMHETWGYEAYHSYQDYECTTNLLDDRFLTACDELYADLTAGTPFFSFVITYSPHLPYTDDEMAQIALEAYPEYMMQEDREVAILRAKAGLTDDMFASLLARLEVDGILEDTVIVGYGDHYAYGLSDKEQLQQLSEDAGSSILERTPAFIYCAGSELSMDVDKVMQITDLAPTILNLFGLEVPAQIMGRDIFDEHYKGHVIFANGSWLTGTTYVKNGVVQWNDGMTEEEISEMNAYVQQVYQVNDAILDSDYYAG